MNERVSSTAKPFEPSRYLIKLPRRARQADGSWATTDTDYLEVKWRLLWLRTEHPEATVETDLISHVAETALFRARVGIPESGSATGWGHESAADFGDYVEKAETKALGRALAALGYGTQFCEDFDFTQGDEQRLVDAPVDRSRMHGDGKPTDMRLHASGSSSVPESADRGQGFVSTRRPAPPVTEPQIKAIYAIARGAQSLNESELDERCRDRYGCLPQELTRRQASEFIDALKLESLSNAS